MILAYPTCIWRIRYGQTRSNFTKIFGVKKLMTLDYRVTLLYDLTFSHFGRTLTCDRQTDGPTDTLHHIVTSSKRKQALTASVSDKFA